MKNTVFKEDTPQSYTKRCEENNKSLAQANKEIKQMLKEQKKD